MLGPLVAKTYLKILQKTPGLWDYVYDNETIARATGELRAAFFSNDCEKLGVPAFCSLPRKTRPVISRFSPC